VSTATATPTAPATAPVGPDRGRVTQARVIRSEWVKLISLRSSWITFAAAVVAVIGIGTLVSFLMASHWSRMPAREQLLFDPIGRSLGGVQLAQLAIGVLGVLVVTGEYSTGMIRSSVMAVPRRLPVLVAKLAVFAVCTFVLMFVSALIAFLLGQQALGVHGVSLGAPDALRAVFGAALYLTLVGAFAMGLGFVVRSTAGGITALFGLLLVLPGVSHLLPDTWQPHVIPYLPSSAGAGLFAAHPEAGMLSTWAGFAVFCAWAAAALIAGAVVLKRRDA
jgi:ABC-type transport system involved in multi-copper enzyme maturation permease subunit